MTETEARRRFASARVARLATVSRSGQPHVVPMVFAVSGETIYSAVDAKPKRTTTLRRISNVVATGTASVIVDHYDDVDWSRLWWVRADGSGRLVEPISAEGRNALDALSSRYVQYREEPPPGPVLAVDVTRWLGWAATGSDEQRG